MQIDQNLGDRARRGRPEALIHNRRLQRLAALA